MRLFNQNLAVVEQSLQPDLQGKISVNVAATATQRGHARTIDKPPIR